MATAIVEPPHLAVDLKVLRLSTVASQWQPLAEQAVRQRPRGHPADHGQQLPVWQPRSRTKCRHPGEAVDDADPRCRAHQHDRVLATVKARRFAPPPLRGADGLDAGCAHGPGRPCPTARERSEEGPECDEMTFEAQVARVVPTRCGSKRAPSRSIVQATLSRRSATERRARA